MTTGRDAIVEGYKTFEDAFQRGDADAIAGMYTPDAQLLIPEAPIISGREAITQVSSSIVESGGNTIRVSVGEVQEAGDWAYEVGGFTATGPGGDVLNAGKYIVVWKRQGAADWRIHRDIFN